MCFHFPDEKTEGQKAGVICLRSHTQPGDGARGTQASHLHPRWLPQPTVCSHITTHSASTITPPFPLPPKTQPSTGLPQSLLNHGETSCFLPLAPTRTGHFCDLNKWPSLKTPRKFTNQSLGEVLLGCKPVHSFCPCVLVWLPRKEGRCTGPGPILYSWALPTLGTGLHQVSMVPNAWPSTAREKAIPGHLSSEAGWVEEGPMPPSSSLWRGPPQ